MYIYCAISPSGKRYIGQTNRDVTTRWREHVYDAFDPNKDQCKALNRAIRKYGADQFRIRVVAYTLPWFLDDLEAELILALNSVVPCGYNIKLGGSSGQHNEATKEKIRCALLGKKFESATLEKRGRSKKMLKHLPMFMVGWYHAGELRGIRVCNHPQRKERRFALSRYENFEACQQAAQQYMDGILFND